jgi:arabinose-5-phosphate isomerase
MPIANINDTIKQMLEKTSKLQRHGAVMVVNDAGELVGIITDADLRRHLTKAQTDGFSTKISEVMTANPKHICSTALAAEAMAIFHKYRIDELPVVDAGNKPIGMIDVQDIVTIKIVN